MLKLKKTILSLLLDVYKRQAQRNQTRKNRIRKNKIRKNGRKLPIRMIKKIPGNRRIRKSIPVWRRQKAGFHIPRMLDVYKRQGSDREDHKAASSERYRTAQKDRYDGHSAGKDRRYHIRIPLCSGRGRGLGWGDRLSLIHI